MYSYRNYRHFERQKQSRWRTCGLFRPFVKIARDFCSFTSMHGFNHIAASRRHWFERFLWALVTALAIWGTVDISLGQWQRFNENPTVVTLEKDFRTWRYNLPAVTACYENRVRPSALPAVITKYFNATPSDEKYSYYARFVSAVADSDVLNLTAFQEFKDDHSLNVDMYQLAVDVMPDTHIKTSWSGAGEVDIGWTPVMTEVGACYSTNSIAITDMAIVSPNPNDTKKFPISCRYSPLTCAVMFDVGQICNFFIHSPFDVMDITIPASHVTMALTRAAHISVMETRCGKGVQDLAPTRRACRYTNEPDGSRRGVFSTNTCRLECRSKLAVKLCGCKPFYYTHGEGPTCTPEGMSCLSSYAHLLVNNAGARCPCAQQCVDAIYKVVSTDEKHWPSQFSNSGSMRYVVQPPRTRYTRDIVFHFQDLVVSFGGAAGLFLGASFISFVEIFYFVAVRFLKFCLVEPPKNRGEVVQVKQQAKTYEKSRMNELNAMIKEIEGQMRPKKPMKLYY